MTSSYQWIVKACESRVEWNMLGSYLNIGLARYYFYRFWISFLWGEKAFSLFRQFIEEFWLKLPTHYLLLLPYTRLYRDNIKFLTYSKFDWDSWYQRRKEPPLDLLKVKNNDKGTKTKLRERPKQRLIHRGDHYSSRSLL